MPIVGEQGCELLDHIDRLVTWKLIYVKLVQVEVEFEIQFASCVTWRRRSGTVVGGCDVIYFRLMNTMTRRLSPEEIGNSRT